MKERNAGNAWTLGRDSIAEYGRQGTKGDRWGRRHKREGETEMKGGYEGGDRMDGMGWTDVWMDMSRIVDEEG